jgi:hypothetical protein
MQLSAVMLHWLHIGCKACSAHIFVKKTSGKSIPDALTTAFTTGSGGNGIPALLAASNTQAAYCLRAESNTAAHATQGRLQVDFRVNL